MRSSVRLRRELRWIVAWSCESAQSLVNLLLSLLHWDLILLRLLFWLLFWEWGLCDRSRRLRAKWLMIIESWSVWLRRCLFYFFRFWRLLGCYFKLRLGYGRVWWFLFFEMFEFKELRSLFWIMTEWDLNRQIFFRLCFFFDLDQLFCTSSCSLTGCWISYIPRYSQQSRNTWLKFLIILDIGREIGNWRVWRAQSMWARWLICESTMRWVLLIELLTFPAGSWTTGWATQLTNAPGSLRLDSGFNLQVCVAIWGVTSTLTGRNRIKSLRNVGFGSFVVLRLAISSVESFLLRTCIATPPEDKSFNTPD